MGVVSVAFSLLSQYLSTTSASGYNWIISVISLVVFIGLVYWFSQKVASLASARDGFSYSQALRFVLAMMLFTGIISGIYTWIMNSFVISDTVTSQFDMMMGQMQDMVDDNSFDTTYNMGHKLLFNPIYLIVISVLGTVLKGGIVGLITSNFVKREPDIFADDTSDGQYQNPSDSTSDDDNSQR